MRGLFVQGRQDFVEAGQGGREFLVDFFSHGLIISVDGFISQIDELDPIIRVLDQVVLKGLTESVFRGVDTDTLFIPQISLKDLPGKIETKFKSLDGRVASKIGF